MEDSVEDPVVEYIRRILANDPVAKSVLMEALVNEQKTPAMIPPYRGKGHWTQSEWEDLITKSRQALTNAKIPIIQTIKRSDHVVHKVPYTLGGQVELIKRAMKGFDHEVVAHETGVYVKVRS